MIVEKAKEPNDINWCNLGSPVLRKIIYKFIGFISFVVITIAYNIAFKNLTIIIYN